MSRRERIRAIITGETTGPCGFWLGNPHAETWPALHAHFGTSNDEQLRRELGDDLRWIPPHHTEGFYRHPDGRSVFGIAKNQQVHCKGGPLAQCEEIAELDAYEWPDSDHLDHGACLEELRLAGDAYRASGHWTCFFHDVMDLFGMEDYLLKLHTHPEVVRAVTDRVCQFYLEANERLFTEAGDLIDGFFFGNDFGTQRDLLMSPRHFDEFLLPWVRSFAELGHRHGYQVILHSCGSVHRVLGRLIEAGIDALHPLQAKAHGMDAETLAREARGRIAFLGGIDAQGILPHGTPDDVRREVHRVRRLLEPALIVSPSHEAILADVPAANVEALARAARSPLGDA